MANKKKPFGQTTVGRIVKGIVGTAVPALNPLLQGTDTSLEGILNVLKGDPGLTAEEKLSIESQILDAIAREEEAVSERWKYDAISDSWMSKNIRPLSYATYSVLVFFLLVADFYSIKFDVSDTWINFIMITHSTMTGAYFGGRTFEKYNKIKQQ